MEEEMKKISYTLPLTIIFSLVLVLFTGCDTSPTDTGDPSVVEGYVTDRDGNSGFSKPAEGIEGATVTLVRLKSNGEFQTVSNSESTTDAQGYFLVETDIDGESHLIVMAEKGTNTWSGVVTNSVENGHTVQTAPLTTETTVEVDVLAKIVAESDNQYSKSQMATEVQNAINADVAKVSHLFDPDYVELATTIMNRMEAKSRAFAADTANAPSAQELDAVINSHVDAQATLETQLFTASGDSASISTAYNAYNDAWLNAYLNAGIDAELYAKAEQIGSYVLVRSSTGLSGDAEFPFAHKSVYHKAIALAKALETEFEALVEASGATSANVDAVSNAGVTLISDVKSATSMSEVSTAFSVYHDTVIDELGAAAEANTNVTSANVITLDTAINTTAKQDLSNAIIQAIGQTSVNFSAIINAYSSFYAFVDTEVKNTLGGLTLDQYEPVLSIAILANIVVN